MKAAVIVATLTCCLLAAISTGNAIFCNPCVQDQCPEARDCSAGKVMDTCGCCEVCAIPKGDSCSTEEPGLCVAGTHCLPDGGLGSGSISGKCLEMTECFSFGCEVVDDESCECGYSNSCPLKTYEFFDLSSCEDSLSENTTDENSTDAGDESDLCVSFGCDIVDDECECNTSDSCPAKTYSYSTEEECEAALQAAACADVHCAVPHVACPEGSYYEPGPQLPGECCPSVGVCWCDEELCPGEPDCPDGFQPHMTSSANDTEGQCCDFYGCKAEACQYGDQVLQNNQLVQVDACTTCRCFEGEVTCNTISCSPPRCEPHEELVFLPENCCPICRPRPIIDPPFVPRCAIEGEFTDPKDPCLLCSCYAGRTACYTKPCLPVDCENPVVRPGECCSVCEDTPTTTEPVTDGVATSADITESTSTPSEGEVTCHNVSCSPLQCQPHEELVSLPESCCPICRPRPIIDPPFVPRCAIEGEFTDPEDPCLLCSCYAGRTACYTKPCAPVDCENPVVRPGECCSICEDSPTTAEPVTESTSTASVPPTTQTEAATTVQTTTGTKATTVSTAPSQQTTQAVTEGGRPQPPISPYVPRPCESFGLYRPERDPCLTCMCVRGWERCVDQSRSLCGEPLCDNPVIMEGHCCPVCIGGTDERVIPSTPSVVVPDPPVVLVAMAIDTAAINSRDSEEILKVIESQMAEMSYTLVDMQIVAHGKTQVELLLVVEVTEEADLSEERVASYLLERLTSVDSSPLSPTRGNKSPDIHKTLASNSAVIVVCVVSVLVALIVLIVFGIFLTVVWIVRQSKRRRETEQKA